MKNLYLISVRMKITKTQKLNDWPNITLNKRNL
jgi:hypothetical protein